MESDRTCASVITADNHLWPPVIGPTYATSPAAPCRWYATRRGTRPTMRAHSCCLLRAIATTGSRHLIDLTPAAPGASTARRAHKIRPATRRAGNHHQPMPDLLPGVRAGLCTLAMRYGELTEYAAKTSTQYRPAARAVVRGRRLADDTEAMLERISIPPHSDVFHRPPSQTRQPPAGVPAVLSANDQPSL